MARKPTCLRTTKSEDMCPWNPWKDLGGHHDVSAQENSPMNSFCGGVTTLSNEEYDSRRRWFVLLPSAIALRDLEPTVPEVAASARNTVQERWLNVRLNHFDASNTDTFPMRFYYNNQFPGPHVVIFVGGEWEIHQAWTQAGLAYDVARAVGAGIFYTEHRYYGQTRPSQDTSTSDLRYLTVDQALGDLAQFIQYVKSEQFEDGKYRNGKVVLVGCSYAGSMATWMKLGYPHLIDGAFSDSGPLHAQEDFPEYVEVISEALRTRGSEECLASVEQAMSQLVALLDTPNGPATVSQLFNTCSIISASTPLDRATFFWFGIQETFAYLVQYATPGDIANACQALTTGSNDPVQRLAAWVTSHPWITSKPCIETRYAEVLAAHSNTSYDSPDAVMRLWTYQTCVEYGWYQTTTGAKHPFQDTVPLEYYHQMCKDFFGPQFDEAFLRSGIERTNTLFAGRTHLPDHVVSVVGGLDPWAPMGPWEGDATHFAPVYVVPEISHCRAVQPLANADTAELNATKYRVANHLTTYLTGQPQFPSSAPSVVASVLLVFGVLAAFDIVQ